MKKHHWHVFWHETLFEKHPQPHCQTRSTSEHPSKRCFRNKNKQACLLTRDEQKIKIAGGGSRFNLNIFFKKYI